MLIMIPHLEEIDPVGADQIDDTMFLRQTA